MRLTVIAAFVAGLCLASPVAAQDASAAHRLELAERLVELSTGDSLEKILQQQVESQIAALGSVPSAEADWMRANLPQMSLRALERMMPELAALYADVFSDAELQAQINFFESPLGRSVANKSARLSLRQQNIVTVAMADFLDELTTKYCAEFDCSGGPAGKTRRR